MRGARVASEERSSEADMRVGSFDQSYQMGIGF